LKVEGNSPETPCRDAENSLKLATVWDIRQQGSAAAQVIAPDREVRKLDFRRDYVTGYIGDLHTVRGGQGSDRIR
jgi:hypothetical protein